MSTASVSRPRVRASESRPMVNAIHRRRPSRGLASSKCSNATILPFRLCAWSVAISMGRRFIAAPYHISWCLNPSACATRAPLRGRTWGAAPRRAPCSSSSARCAARVGDDMRGQPEGASPRGRMLDAVPRRPRWLAENAALSDNAKTTADVRGASRASPRGAILAPSPRRLRRGAHVPGALDEAENYRSASCARASSGVFAGTEQHVGQLFDGVPSRGGWGPTITGSASLHTAGRAAFREHLMERERPRRAGRLRRARLRRATGTSSRRRLEDGDWTLFGAHRLGNSSTLRPAPPRRGRRADLGAPGWPMAMARSGLASPRRPRWAPWWPSTGCSCPRIAGLHDVVEATSRTWRMTFARAARGLRRSTRR